MDIDKLVESILEKHSSLPPIENGECSCQAIDCALYHRFAKRTHGLIEKAWIDVGRTADTGKVCISMQISEKYVEYLGLRWQCFWSYLVYGESRKQIQVKDKYLPSYPNKYYRELVAKQLFTCDSRKNCQCVFAIIPDFIMQAWPKGKDLDIYQQYCIISRHETADDVLRRCIEMPSPLLAKQPKENCYGAMHSRLC